MWNAVASLDSTSPAPSARSKHSATLIGEHVYLLGGRNGNLPLKDFWKYNLVTGRWHQLKPSGDKLPCLQEHSAIAYKDNIYVFGGEVGFSAGTETPLWIYDIKANIWKKIRSKKGVAAPKGRRGHTALVYKGSMFIYGGYQDLRGSCSELWAFHFDTESWHLISSSPMKSSGGSDVFPAPRHKHSAIIHDDALWIYGGMTDLQERSDLWRWDSRTRSWTNIKTKINPGPLHSHAACRFPSFMIIFGGERGGHPTNELWKFNFGAEMWEKIVTPGLKPSPRAESVALTVSELLLNDSSVNTLEERAAKVRLRTCSSADRGGRHSSYLPSNRVAPSEKTYVFKPSQNNYTDGSEFSDTRASRSILQEISKLSQINISRLNNKCSYTVLSGCNGDSTESLLKQHASPSKLEPELDLEIASSMPVRGKMVKSKSAFVIKKTNLESTPTSPDDNIEYPVKKRVEFDMTTTKIPREPISVPNFSLINLPTPVLTPVEATKLVYLDTDDENDLGIEYQNNRENKIAESKYENLNIMKRGESYSSHLGYADNPLYQHMVKSSQYIEENVSSTSDYASIETVNRLSSASNYSVKTTTPQEENLKNRERDKQGPFGFCNPNYMRPDVKSVALSGDHDRKKVVQILNDVETEHFDRSQEDLLEMQNCNESFSRNTKVLYRNSARVARPPKSLSIDSGTRVKDNNKCRALSAGGAERRKKIEKVDNNCIESSFPFFVYLIGGKEHGQVTVFQRPISIWKLKLC